MSDPASLHGDPPSPAPEPPLVLALDAQISQVDNALLSPTSAQDHDQDQDQELQPQPTTAPAFRALERLIVHPDDLLPAGPVAVDYGVLENGLHYYVRKNAKPRERAALALGVKVGYADLRMFAIALLLSVAAFVEFLEPSRMSAWKEILDANTRIALDKDFVCE